MTDSIIVYRSQVEANVDRAITQSPNFFPVICGVVVFIVVYGLLTTYTKRKCGSNGVKLGIGAVAGIATTWYLWI